jgi:hypothetical protein
LFVDYDNAIEEKKSQANNSLIIEELNQLKTEIEYKISKGVNNKDINLFRTKLFRLSQIVEKAYIDESYKELIVSLQEKINIEAIKPSVEIMNNKRNDKMDDDISKALSLYQLVPIDANTLKRHIAGLFYLSLFDRSQKAGINDSWKEKVAEILMNENYRGFFEYNILNNKEDNAKRVFIAIGGTLFIFSGIVIDKNAERELMAGRSFLDKNNYNDPFKNQRYYIYRW